MVVKRPSMGKFKPGSHADDRVLAESQRGVGHEVSTQMWILLMVDCVRAEACWNLFLDAREEKCGAHIWQKVHLICLFEPFYLAQ